MTKLIINHNRIRLAIRIIFFMLLKELADGSGARHHLSLKALISPFPTSHKILGSVLSLASNNLFQTVEIPCLILQSEGCNLAQYLSSMKEDHKVLFCLSLHHNFMA